MWRGVQQLFRSCADFGVDFARIFIRGVCSLYDFSPKLHAKIHEDQNTIHAPCRWGAKRKSTKQNFTEDTA